MKKCVVIIPFHNQTLNDYEKASLKQLNNVFNGKYDIVLVTPEGLNVNDVTNLLSNSDIIHQKTFNNDFFKSQLAYCSLVSSPFFYECFTDYEYMLIYQLDCWVFRDELEYWCNKNYDYIGAPFFVPWFVERQRQVGNGGFSLRKIQSCINYLKTNDNPNLPHYHTDDGFFAANYGNMLSIPDLNTACLFSLETFPKELFNNTKRLPFGCHAFKRYDWNFWKKYINLNNTTNSLSTLICCIGKNENRYVSEYVTHYKNLGVTHITIYDNNDINGEHFEDILQNEINNGFVDVIDYRGRKVCQLQAYAECYHNNKNNYDWILFIDCGDEYLELKNYNTISDYLSCSKFDWFDMIHINLMTVGDNEMLTYENIPLRERFKEPIPFNTNVAYNFPENYHVSSIVRGGLDDIQWTVSPHTPTPNNLRCCNGSGNPCDPNAIFIPYDFDEAYFKHYTTKTADEYCDKMLRGFPDMYWDGKMIQYLIETRFFRVNTITQEKIDIFKSKLGIDMSYLLKK